ncbi:MAG TPA: hypothetical protein VGN46_14155 [Luteibacter sp.]|jgi:hypothetical protein|uniref:hypothetical protein n=1 Tax=Luteibacter sp. TaxID=1886636 RepID=UPI002F3E3467
MQSAKAGFDRAIDWLNVAAHVLAAATVVRRSGTNALVKFDGQRDNDKVYTVFVGRGEDDESRFREDSDDLEELVTRAFPLSTEQSLDDAVPLSGMLQRLHALASEGFVVCIYMAWLADAVAYSVDIMGELGVFNPIHVEGQALLEIMQQSVQQFDQ